MSKTESNGEPLEVSVSAGKQDAESWPESFIPDVVSIRKFQVNDVVRVMAEGSQEYIVLVHRDHEPCCQIQRTDDLKRREWMISEELELVTEIVDNHSDLPKQTSAAELPKTRNS